MVSLGHVNKNGLRYGTDKQIFSIFETFKF